MSTRIKVCVGLMLAAMGAASFPFAMKDQAPDSDEHPASTAGLIDSSGLYHSSFGSIQFRANEGWDLEALTYRASGFDPVDGPIWFVMHGASRAAERYIRTAAPAAERYGALALAIRFPKALYPSSSDYTLGVTTRGSANGSAHAEGRWRDPATYTYSTVERVFDAIRAVLEGRQNGYYLFGHSAGAQFTHRLMTFLGNPRTLGAVAANAGWYTMPVDRPERNFTMPYGLHGAPIGDDELRSFFASRFYVMLGERDTSTASNDRLVRGTRQAMAQGPNRLARGERYYATAREQARMLNTAFTWNMVIVPRAGHSAAQVVDSAAYLLFEPNAHPCVPTGAGDAQGLYITEILADPPSSIAGDANHDGHRDPAEDEFVELVNLGSKPICLSGWAMGDAKRKERHVFPVGTSLQPGSTLVVFGGGIPPATIGAASTLTANFDGRLSLTNSGDVLTLRDAADRVASRVSWGDCAGETCAADHYEGSLNISSSITRSPADRSTWQQFQTSQRETSSPGRHPNTARSQI